ncbi:MAG TPA: hypothetical protein VLG50_08915 [Candidatus Saccharimonadales bacterium]|nr:hypothetical protein [Candidatus Saccharimonadales bacterium]
MKFHKRLVAVALILLSSATFPLNDREHGILYDQHGRHIHRPTHIEYRDALLYKARYEGRLAFYHKRIRTGKVKRLKSDNHVHGITKYYQAVETVNNYLNMFPEDKVE